MNRSSAKLNVQQKTIVSVVVISYNQSKYIEQTLKSIVSQQQDGFHLQLIIADDCSTDGTEKIINAFYRKYKNLFDIQFISRKRNFGIQHNLLTAMDECKGDLIALCEGDDYWTDNRKLAKQVSYMKKHDTSALCFHPVQILSQDNKQFDGIYPSKELGIKYNKSNLLARNFIQTNSVMYRNIGDYNKRLTDDVLPLDWFLHVLHSQYGRIGYIDDVMAVYRRHKDGVWWQTKENIDEFWLTNALKHVRMYEAIEQISRNLSAKKMTQQQKALLIRTILDKVSVPARNKIIMQLYDKARQSFLEFQGFVVKENKQLRESVAELENDTRRNKQDNENLQQSLDELHGIYDAIQNSMSWRITKPLRAVKTGFRRK